MQRYRVAVAAAIPTFWYFAEARTSPRALFPFKISSNSPQGIAIWHIIAIFAVKMVLE